MTQPAHSEPPRTYRGMDRATIDVAYDNAAAFGDVPYWREVWRTRTGQLSIPRGALLDIPYGSGPRQTIDLFPVGRDQAPTVLFFHGGFWSRNDKGTFRFLLEAIHRAGCNAAFAGYTLAPVADFGEIVSSASEATRWLIAHLADFGLAAQGIVLLGWSAGAHLVALQMSQPGIAAGIAISGIYDLEPMHVGSLNDGLGLNAAAVEKYSPHRLRLTCTAPLLVAYGERELPEFKRQSVDFHDAWARQSLPVTLVPLPGHHHHSVLEELHAPSGRLSTALARLVRLNHD